MLKKSFLTSMGHQGFFAVPGTIIRVVIKNSVDSVIQDGES